MRNVPKLLISFLLVSGLSTAPACAGMLEGIPLATQRVTEASLALDMISAHIDGLSVLSDEQQDDVDEAVEKARLALGTASNTLRGADNLTEGEIDEALVEFRKAYADLLLLTGPMGVRSDSAGMYGADPGGGIVVPSPSAFTAGSV